MASEIRISELDTKSTIDDENLIIIEDDIDTKKSTVRDLKDAFNVDYSDPSTQKFYSSDKMNSMLRQVKSESKADNKDNIDDVKQQLNNLLATSTIELAVLLPCVVTKIVTLSDSSSSLDDSNSNAIYSTSTDGTGK